ncbi:MAG: segregation/condensation protein A [Syntrophomonadaceae bacterium]|nr:segregation/condensation protein A [Syntrophomonadaceae bacterium]
MTIDKVMSNLAYVVDLESFHGPLDLLLYLIEENELDIYDIPIASISDQYLSYLQASGDFDLDKMGDFLIMASYLLNLKSQMLLPKRPAVEEEESELLDPRQELVQKLLDYKKYKNAAEYLQQRQSGEISRVFYRSSDLQYLPNRELAAETTMLFRAYQTLLREYNKSEGTYLLPQGDVNIADKMEEISNLLHRKPEGMVFQDLFAEVHNLREALALFLALLELLRLQRVQAIQDQAFGEIIVSLRVAI